MESVTLPEAVAMVIATIPAKCTGLVTTITVPSGEMETSVARNPPKVTGGRFPNEAENRGGNGGAASAGPVDVEACEVGDDAGWWEVNEFLR